MLILPSILSHNSRNTPTSDPWDIAQSLVDHANPTEAKHSVCFIKNRLVLHTSLQAQRLPDRLAGDTCCQAPSASNATVSTSIAWRDNPYRQAQYASILYWFCSHHLAVKHIARCYTSTCAKLVFKHPKQSKINPFPFHIHSPPLNPC